jgi:hypothetical protein
MNLKINQIELKYYIYIYLIFKIIFKELAKTFYDKSGAKLSIDNLRELVSPVILNEDKSVIDKKKKKF